MAFVFSSATIEIKKSQPQVSVGDENFKKLVTYIEKNGQVISKKNPCSFFFTYIDKEGNECKMTTSRTNEKGVESPKGSVGNIRCLLFCKGSCDKNLFFITNKRLLIKSSKDFDVVKRGYENFLFQVNENKNLVLNR